MYNKAVRLVFCVEVNIMKITDSEGLGNIIRNRRKELKYTQAFLSEYTGLSVSFISDVERGKTTVEIGKVMQLISILGLDININVKYSLQGTTQGNGLTGGVPPVRFSM
jgi:HTH-type transcriptional regulator/antitoxin HipB